MPAKVEVQRAENAALYACPPEFDIICRFDSVAPN